MSALSATEIRWGVRWLRLAVVTKVPCRSERSASEHGDGVPRRKSGCFRHREGWRERDGVATACFKHRGRRGGAVGVVSGNGSPE